MNTTTYVKPDADTVQAAIAQNILGQLGGNRFIAMTGSKNFCSHARNEKAGIRGGLSFKIGRGAKDGITHVRVFLTDADLYTVEFVKVRGASVRTLTESHNVYADMLRATFTRNTGFEVSL